MLKIGEKQELEIVKRVDFGVYLAEDRDAKERVLLPKKETEPEMNCGDRVTVFLYRDSQDRMIATRREPLLTLGRTAVLKVRDVTRIGAFLGWGLEKDLLLPFHEQTAKVYPGDECVAALYVDKSGRLCATMKVYQYLSQNSPYQIGDQVRGRVYELSGNFGAFVAVEDHYSGMIPKYEVTEELRVGSIVRARVTGVKEDGKLDLSIREKAYIQMDEDAEYILQVIDEYEGVLPFDDRVSPEIIKREFGLSKNAFKRAVGRLMKQGKVEITEGKIRRKQAAPQTLRYETEKAKYPAVGRTDAGTQN